MLFVVAAGGAYSFKTAGSATPAPRIGYTNWTSPCSGEVNCDTFDNDVLCTAIVGGQTRVARGKLNPSDVSCPITLYMPEEN